MPVVLLRSPDGPDDPYVAALSEAGLEAQSEPVLRFTFPHQKALRDRLDREAYVALIATSPRVGRALHPLFRDHPDLGATWRNRPAYAVGPKTASWLRRLGLSVRGEDSGSASALADRIVADEPAGRLLFLCGNRRRNTLPTCLQRADVPFDEQVVYETHTRSTLDLPAPGPDTWLVFFSPSGLEATRQAGVDLRDYRVAAIGPTTAGALRDAGATVAAVADKPAPEPLARALRAAERKN